MSATALAATFLAALAVAWLATPLAGRLARRLGAMDRADGGRKVHRLPVPRLGGAAVVVALAAALASAAALLPDLRADPRLPWMAGGGLAVAALGFADDLGGLRAWHRLAVELGLGAALWAGGLRVDELGHPFGEPIALGPLSLPFTMLWVAGAANAMNLVDGLDGLAGGVAAFAAAAAGVLALRRGDALMAVTAAGVTGACLGFLRHNLHPASIFLGDGGSLLLGYALAVAALPAPGAARAGLDLLPPLVALALPVGDTALAIGRRALAGAPLFGADRGHLHHRLLDRGLGHGEAVRVLHSAAAVHAAAALALAELRGPAAAVVLGALLALDAVGLAALGFRPAALPALLAGRRGRPRLTGPSAAARPRPGPW